MSRVIRRLIILILPLLLAPVTLAQQPASSASNSHDQQSLKIKTNEVLLDVIVRDKRGRPITDLRADEIEVFEDGVRQQINSLRLVNGNEGQKPDQPSGKGSKTGPAEPTQIDPARQINLVTIVFDQLDPGGNRLARSSALNFVNSFLPSNTLVRVFVIGRTLYVIEPFTNDRVKLRQAIERATGGDERSWMDFSGQILNQLKVITNNGSLADAALNNPNAMPERPDPGDQRPGTEDLNMAQNMAQSMAWMTLDTMLLAERAQRESAATSSVYSLLHIAKEQRRLAGRKAVIYFSAGLQIPRGLSEVFRTAISEANRANVSFYAVDARGLAVMTESFASRVESAVVISASRRPTLRSSAPNPDSFRLFDMLESAASADMQAQLRDLSSGTGGFAITNNNDLSGALRRIANDFTGYYAVAYTPTAQEFDGRFREITVRIARPGGKAQTRKGYFAVPSINGRPVIAYELPMLAALNGAVVPHDFTHHNGALRFESRDSKTHCVIAFQTDLSNFAFTEDKAKKIHRVNFSALALVKNESGEIVERFSENHPLEIPPRYLDDARKADFILSRDFYFAPGRYVLETVLHDREANRFSAHRKSFTIAASKGGLQTSALSVVKRIEQLENKASAESTNPLLAQDKRIVPDLTDNFSINSGETISLHLAIFPDGKVKTAPTLTLTLRRDQETVATTAPALPGADEKGRITFTAGVPTSNLTPGTYHLRATVNQADATAREDLSFTIRGESKSVGAPLVGASADEEPGAINTALDSPDKVGDTPSGLTLLAIREARPFEVVIPDLLREVETSGGLMNARLGKYTYSLRKVRRILDKKGRIRKEEYQDFEAFPVNGRHALVQLAENGVDLSRDRVNFEREDATRFLVQDEEQKRQGSTELKPNGGYWNARLAGIAQNKAVSLVIDPAIFFRECEFSLPRSVDLDGRPTIVLNFRPRASATTDTRTAYIRQLEGSVWIDAADKTLARIEGRKTPSANNASSSPNFVYQQHRLPSGLWAPSLIRINALGDETLFNGLNWDAWFEFGDFKQFDAIDSDVKLLSPENKKGNP